MPQNKPSEEVADALMSRLWSEEFLPGDTGLFALLDAARDPRIFHAIGTSGLDYECLFSGKLPRVLAMAAPYIARLERDSEFARMLAVQGWGNSWGVYAASDAGFEELRKHFRRFLKVKDMSTRKSMLFRYFDPRVLRVYLPTCLSEELRFVMDPVRHFLVEHEDPSKLAVFGLEFPVGLGGECRLSTRVLRL